MKKRKVALVVLHTGRPADLASPLFHANALFLLKSYLESRPEISARYEFEIVDLRRHVPYNLGLAVEQNIDVVQDVVARRPDVVAFSLYLWNVEAGQALARVFREFLPRAVFVAGGPEVSDRREFARRFPGFDVLVEGDGEIPLRRVLQALARGRSLRGIGGVSFVERGRFVHDPAGAELAAPDEIPDFHAANRPLLDGRGFYLTTRGCPYDCAMCLWARQPMRRKSRDRILSELEALTASPLRGLTLFDYDLLEVHTRDRDFFDRLTRMVRARRDGFGINFFINPRYLTDPRLPAVMAALRSHHVLVGVQSTSPACLEAIGRGWSIPWLGVLEQAPPQVRERVFLELIFPLPGQTGPEFLDSLRRLLALGYYRLQIFQLCLLRGTRLYRNRRRLGLVHLERPPYACIATPSISADEGLRIGVLCQALNLLRDLVDPAPDRRPFADYFRRRPKVVDRLLAQVDRGAGSWDLADHLSREITGRPLELDHAR
ncbi:MAG: cobalamin-dependent protein [Deltaproteobacteria bacterium]|nr:cobalamin-dependent protein [Deltaproteobacteria bacterium]